MIDFIMGVERSEKMKTRTSAFLATLAVMTVLMPVIGAKAEPAKTVGESIPDAAAPETKQSDAAGPSAAPVRATAAKQAAQQTKYSFGVDEVVKMYQRGVETEVILNYIENSSVPYRHRAEEGVWLKGAGGTTALS